jgi:hypothetical protein
MFRAVTLMVMGCPPPAGWVVVGAGCVVCGVVLAGVVGWLAVVVFAVVAGDVVDAVDDEHPTRMPSVHSAKATPIAPRNLDLLFFISFPLA